MTWTRGGSSCCAGSCRRSLSAVLALVRPAAFTHVEYGVYDTLVRASPGPAHRAGGDRGRGRAEPVRHRPVAVAARRRGHARRTLRELGAATIGVDVIFAESDRRDGADAPDAALAKTLRRAASCSATRCGSTTSAAPTAPACRRRSACPCDAARTRRNPCSAPPAPSAACPSSPRPRAAQGFLNAAPDSDGILRRVPLLMQLGDGTYPSLALATVAAMTGTQRRRPARRERQRQHPCGRRTRDPARRQEQSAGALPRQEAARSATCRRPT